MRSLSLSNRPPVCPSVGRPAQPLTLPARIADKAFYQQPDADVIGYVYVRWHLNLGAGLWLWGRLQ